MAVDVVSVSLLSRIAAFMAKNWRTLCQWLWEAIRDPARGHRFVVLVCDLKHDKDRQQKEFVTTALRRRGIPFRLRSMELRPPLQVEDSVEEEEQLFKRGQRLLEGENADLLICGGVAVNNQWLRLHFIGRHGNGNLRWKPFSLNFGEVSDDFHEILEESIVAASIASVRSYWCKRPNQWIQDMHQSEKKLSDLIDRDRRPFGETHLRTLRLLVAWLRYRIGEVTGDSGNLRSAAAILLEVIKSIERDRCPFDWAEAHNNLGIVFSHLGERESKREILDCAIRAFRTAQEGYTRQSAALDRAAVQHNLGVALVRVGELGGGNQLFRSGITDLREALEIRTRERVPLDWATTQDSLGTAFARLGEIEANMSHLEEAVKSFRSALQERTRKRVPLEWANTQHNLGNALLRLGEGNGSVERLKQAVKAFRAALMKRTRTRVPVYWAMTQQSLGCTLTALGEREKGTRHLKSSIRVLRDALKVSTRNRDPLSWALIQSNLGVSLFELGKRRQRTYLVKQAVRSYCDALEEYSLESAPLDCARTQFNLALSLIWLAAHEGESREQLRGNAVTALRIAVIGSHACGAIQLEKSALSELARVEREFNSKK